MRNLLKFSTHTNKTAEKTQKKNQKKSLVIHHCSSRYLCTFIKCLLIQLKKTATTAVKLTDWLFYIQNFRPNHQYHCTKHRTLTTFKPFKPSFYCMRYIKKMINKSTRENLLLTEDFLKLLVEFKNTKPAVNQAWICTVERTLNIFCRHKSLSRNKKAEIRLLIQQDYCPWRLLKTDFYQSKKHSYSSEKK